MSGKGWWNSAISGLESKLDTILAEDDQASAKSRAADTAAKQQGADKAPPVDKKLAVESEASRNSSRSRPNSRLQDRLAKAVNKGTDRSESRASSDFGSRPESPALRSPAIVAVADTGRTSIDSKVSEAVTEAADATKEDVVEAATQETQANVSPRTSTEAPAPTVSPLVAPLPATTVVNEQSTATPVPTISLPSIVTPQTASPRQSLDSNFSHPSIDASAPSQSIDAGARNSIEVEAELSLLQDTYEDTLRDNREELNAHLERIDTLQSKLIYLSQQLSAASKAVSLDAEATSEDKKLADKDAKIAALMEEGQKLSKTEMKHMATIKKLRLKSQEQDRELVTFKQRLSKAEKGIAEQTEKAKRAEAGEKSAQEKLKIVGKIEKDIDSIRAEREEAGLTISELRRQLNDALLRVEDAEKRVQAGALEAEKRVTASLREDMENSRIEKKLAEDRAKRELHASRDEVKSQQDKAKVAELELRGEIANLESKLEFLRSRTEEATSSATSDSQAQLLRQIETLQTQYSLASENWQGIETTLTSRVAALEKDRDETAKRESDIRRKAREVNSKARRLEDELEAINERARAFKHDLTEQRSAAQKLQARLNQAETIAHDARADLDREKKVWEAEFHQRLENEKSKWKQDTQQQAFPGDASHLHAESPSISHRKHSPDPLNIYNRRGMPRSISGGMDMPLSPMDRMFDEAIRRPSGSRTKTTPKARTPEIGTPPLRQNSIPSNLNGANAIDTPSIHTMDHDDPFDNISSSHRTINDMMSVSTVGAGPSVQLVERMSAAVRRLESEKATFKEEMSRLSGQRDEAREEVVALMQEIEEKRAQDQKVDRLELESKGMDQRYQTTLEMLGEKTERVEELEGDVEDLKKMYRELVQTMK